MQAHEPEKTSSAQVIANYKLLSALTVQMLKAAEDGNWEELIAIEQQCSNLVDGMKPVDAETRLDEAARQYKNQLIQQILADEAKIGNLARAWMAQFKDLMQSNLQEQRLLKTYGRTTAD